MVLSPAQTPNWDLVSDIVNNVSRTYRSPKQCRNRYEFVIAPREEGRIVVDPSLKKQKKNKTPQQPKTNRVMRTAQLYVQDNHQAWKLLMSQKFEVIKIIASKRKPTVKPLLVNPTMRNPKHASVLAECGINYDMPLNPVEIANRRAERLAKEKQKTALTAEQQHAVQRAQQQLQASPTIISKTVGPSTSGQVQQVAVAATSVAASPAAQAVVVGISQASPAVVVSTVIATGTVTTLTPGLRAQQRSIQELVAGTSTSAIVSVASISPAGQRLAPPQTVVSAAVAKTIPGGGAVTASGKTLTAAQFQLLRLRQQQQQRLASQQQMKVLQAGQTVTAVPGQKVAVAMGSGAITQQRAQLMKQAVAGKQTLSRTMTESEMAAMLKRQQQLIAQQKAQQATQAHLLAQQIQQAGTSSQPQVATLVKAVSSSPTMTIPVTSMTLPQVKAALTPGVKTATQQQIRQLTIQQQIMQQRKLPVQKVTQLAQVAGKAGVPTQLIVPPNKQIQATMTVQQIQQVMKHVQPQHITHVSGAQTVVGPKGVQVTAGQTLQTRVIPMSSGQAQTIQVVTAAPGTVRTSVPNVTIDSSGRPQVSVASGTIKVSPSVSTAQQQAILSQMNAALQGQQLQQVRQAGQHPLRIQAVAVQQSQATSTTQPHQPDNSHT